VNALAAGPRTTVPGSSPCYYPPPSGEMVDAGQPVGSGLKGRARGGCARFEPRDSYGRVLFLPGFLSPFFPFWACGRFSMYSDPEGTANREDATMCWKAAVGSLLSSSSSLIAEAYQARRGEATGTWHPRAVHSQGSIDMPVPGRLAARHSSPLFPPPLPFFSFSDRFENARLYGRVRRSSTDKQTEEKTVLGIVRLLRAAPGPFSPFPSSILFLFPSPYRLLSAASIRWFG